MNRYKNLHSKFDTPIPTYYGLTLLYRLIFTVIILACQPMTFNELVDLLSVKIGEEPSSRRRRTRSVILSACSPFVEIDYDKDFVNPTLRLVHKSVGDFLTQDPTTTSFVTEDCYKFFVKWPQGNADIGLRCLSYLSYKRYADFGDPSLADSAEHGLLKYASIFWYKHIEFGGQNRELFEAVRDFLKSPNFWTCIRVQAKYAPHTFAKLSYDAGTNYYKMASPNSTSTPDKEYYADALPMWLGEYDNEGDDLIWSFHMFVREWGEVLVKHPGQIQDYFAKILGNRGFWFVKSREDSGVRVKLIDTSTSLSTIIGLGSVEEQCMPAWQIEAVPKLGAKTMGGRKTPIYITETITKTKSQWDLQHRATVRYGQKAATIYRYKSRTSGTLAKEDESDEDSSGEDDDKNGTSHEPSIWFLSLTNGSDTLKWFHHITKSGIVQRSAPIFIHGTPWLLWPQDESAILILNLDTWKSHISKLPAVRRVGDCMMISQGRSPPLL